MRLRLTVLLACVAGMLFTAGPAQTIVGGQEDGTAHPYVGFVRYQYPDPTSPTGISSSVCSAVAIDSTHLVSAAHCARDGAEVKVVFESVVPRAEYPGGPTLFDGPTASTGEFNAIPGSCFNCAAKGQGDLAVIVLAEPVTLSRYATLTQTAPAKKAGVTVVGYGVADAKTMSGAGVRRYVDTTLIPTSSSDTYLRVSSAKGGACYGDSGGFVGAGDTIYAVVSTGSQMCGGNGEAYGVFSAEARAFLSSFGL